MRMNHVLSGIGKNLEQAQIQLETTETRLEAAKVEVTKPFQQEKELSEKLDRLNELNALLNMDETGAAHEEKEQTVQNKREKLLDAEGKTQTEKKQIRSLSDRIAHKQGLIDAKEAEQRSDIKQKKQLER